MRLGVIGSSSSHVDRATVTSGDDHEAVRGSRGRPVAEHEHVQEEHADGTRQDHVSKGRPCLTTLGQRELIAC